MLFQQPNDVALKRVEFIGAFGDRGPLVTLPPRSLAHRVEAQFKFASNLPQAELLLDEQLPDLTISLIIDHGWPPNTLRKTSPTLTEPERDAPTRSRLRTW